VVRQCVACGTFDTPEWRKGPCGPRTLCNACGLVFSKIMRREREDLKKKAEGDASVSINEGEKVARIMEEVIAVSKMKENKHALSEPFLNKFLSPSSSTSTSNYSSGTKPKEGGERLSIVETESEQLVEQELFQERKSKRARLVGVENTTTSPPSQSQPQPPLIPLACDVDTPSASAAISFVYTAALKKEIPAPRSPSPTFKIGGGSRGTESTSFNIPHANSSLYGNQVGAGVAGLTMNYSWLKEQPSLSFTSSTPTPPTPPTPALATSSVPPKAEMTSQDKRNSLSYLLN
jgi:hypothetical protein